MSQLNEDETSLKPKIAHFANSGSLGDEAGDMPGNNESLDRSELTSLYPAAKTVTQQRGDMLRRLEANKRSLPQYPHFRIALLGSVLFWVILLLAKNIEPLWMAGSMAAIFGSFAVALALGFVARAWIQYTTEAFYLFGGPLTGFWLVYGTGVLSLLGLWQSGWIGSPTDFFWTPVLSGLHFILVFFSLRLLLKSKL